MFDANRSFETPSFKHSFQPLYGDWRNTPWHTIGAPQEAVTGCGRELESEEAPGWSRLPARDVSWGAAGPWPPRGTSLLWESARGVPR